MASIRINRPIVVWRYTISFKQLLLRSVKGSEHSTRLDVLFSGVAALSMRTSYNDGLRILEASYPDSEAILSTAGVDSQEGVTCFELVAPSARDWIVASYMQMAEDEGDYDEPSSLGIDWGGTG